MKFSIITPCFNGGKYIRQCLESVRVQKGCDVEHIVQDAGSTDGTLDILKDYPSARVYVESDTGMSDGINKGTEKATGDWWMWLNADDWLLLGALKRVGEFLNSVPDADVVYGDFYYTDESGKKTRDAKLFPFDRMMMIHYGCYIGSTATFFRKSTTIDAGHLLDINFKQAMDQEYFARLGTLGLRFRHVKGGPLAAFRLHDDNTSRRYSQGRDMNSIFHRQMQIAEGAATRRKYGISISATNPFLNGISDAGLWYFYRGKKVLTKFFNGCYQL